MRRLSLFCGAVLAGLCIGIGGTVYLSVENTVAGALLFTVGLYAICAHGLNLYTGKVGYLIVRRAGYLSDLLLIWLGNLLGTFVTGTAVRMTRFSGVSVRAEAMCAAKNADSLLSLLLLGVFCGLLMYAAVEGWRTTRQPAILFACVAGFILCGFEHCIADMYYYSVAGAWTWDALGRIAVITLGNSLGGILIPLFKRPEID